jgi:hypothetical protein
MDSGPALSPVEAISANLRMILRGLLVALGAWRLEPALGLVLYARIGRNFGQIERLLVRYYAGRLRRYLKPRANGPRRCGGLAGCGPALPRKFGWLVVMGGSEAVCYGSQLQHVLNTPVMAELLAASPQAVRILRPLCRALAMELPWTVAEPRARKPRVRKPRQAPEPFRIPLPRGVLTAARRQGFGKMC